MLEMYTITGGAWFRESFNAIAAFMGTDGFKFLIKFATVTAIFLTIWHWIKNRDPRIFLYWLFVIIFSNIMISTKRSIQIIDSSQPGMVYQVDNVPMGLALPAHLFTFLGQGILEGYERVFHLPDSVTYSKGGMLFGANMVVRSTDFVSVNPEISGLFSDYVQNCVIGDIYLNHKYTLEDLMTSQDPYTLIFANPSPLRGVFDKNNIFRTCAFVANDLTRAIGLDTQTGGATWNYYVRSLFGGRPNADFLMGELLGNSYQHFYGTSQSASEIMKKNVTINALRKGISSFASRNDDTAGLLNLSETAAMSKLRLSQATTGEITARQLPVMQTVILGILIGLFPIIILLGMINVITIQVWKGYITSIIWLQSWPLLFAILNHSMSFNLRQQMTGQPLTLSSVSTLQQNFSDIATMSAWISGFIPFISYSLIALGRGLSQAGSYMGTATQSASSQSSSQATDGTWAFNNMQTDNVQGFKWDTNSATSNGQMSSQAISGASVTRTAGGQTVYNTDGAMSKLPVHIGFGKMLSSSYQQQARESQAQAESSLSGYNSSVTSGLNQLAQVGKQAGSSDSMVNSSDSSSATTTSIAAQKMQSAVDSYAKANNVSNREAFNQLMDKSTRGTLSAGTRGGVKGELGVSLFGSGVQGYADAHVAGDLSGSSGSSHGTDKSGSRTEDSSNNQSAQAVRDFRSSMDVLSSEKAGTSGSHTDNSSDSMVNQLGATLSEAKNSYEQYTSSMTKSKEYSELATKTQNMSANIDSSYDQQFVDYVSNKSPENAHAILTDTSSPAVAIQREQLAQSFVNEHLAPRLAQEYRENPDMISTSPTNTGRNSNNSSSNQEIKEGQAPSDMRNDFTKNKSLIDSEGHKVGIENDVSERVSNHNRDARSNIDNNTNSIGTNKATVDSQYDNLKEQHISSNEKNQQSYNKEVDNQNRAVPISVAGLAAQEVTDMIEKEKNNE